MLGGSETGLQTMSDDNIDIVNDNTQAVYTE